MQSWTAFSEGAKPLGRTIFTENPAFTEVSLFDVRVIMTIMCVLMVELLCQVVTRWISVLE
jgi:hypothetical protein